MSQREAAACGLPSVAVRWSGTADDIDQWGVPLEQFKLVESGMEGCGGKWAEPSLDEIVWRMRDMYQNQDEYKARALKSAQWLRSNATYEHAARKLVQITSDFMGGHVPEQEPETSQVVNRSDGHGLVQRKVLVEQFS